MNANLLQEEDLDIKLLSFKNLMKDEAVKDVIKNIHKKKQVTEQDALDIVTSANLTVLLEAAL